MSAFDKPVSQVDANKFIPIACHYNQDTLLTKNGQLIQIFCIENTHQLGNHITLFYNVRKLLRDAIQKHVDSNKFAFWFSVVRDEVDLNSKAKWDIEFCRELNELWSQKYFWHKRYTNKLYVSVVYHHVDLSIANFNSFFNSFRQSFVNDFHDKYLEQACLQLTELVNKLCQELEIFNVKKLAIVAKDEECFSELERAMEEIFYINSSNNPLDEVELAKLLEPESYTVHHNHIEIERNGAKKVCSILALKQYQDMPIEILDLIAQVPYKMSITEIITFIDKKQATKDLEPVQYIFNSSKAQNMLEASGIKKMFEAEGNTAFISQQINLCIMAEDQEKLSSSVVKVSDLLDKFGIVHVCEDIDVEYAFWSRFPGNFHLITRASPALTKDCAAFTSPYSFPSGDRQSIWGSELTIFKTVGNTPYYFNFHDQDNGHSIICGYKGDGKAVFLNLLIAMATQYDPQILYIYHSIRSQIFLELLGAKIVDHLNLPNPLIVLEQKEILEWLKLLCGAGVSSLTQDEEKLLAAITAYLSSLPENERLLAKVASFDYSAYQNYSRIKQELELFSVGGIYQDIKFSAVGGDEKIHAVNLAFFTEQSFRIANYPKQEKLLPIYMANLAKHMQVRSAIVFALSKMFAKQQNQKPKILVLTNLDSLISPEHFDDGMAQILDEIRQNNGIVLSTLDMAAQAKFEGSKFWQQFLSKQASVMVLTGENIKARCQSFLGFNDQEMQVLLNLPSKSRILVIKQYAFLLSVEVNLNDCFHIAKILSASEQDLTQYLELKKSETKENFLKKLYEVLQAD